MLVPGNILHWISLLPHVVDHWEKRSSLCLCIYPFAACPHCHFELGFASGEIICWNVRNHLHFSIYLLIYN